MAFLVPIAVAIGKEVAEDIKEKVANNDDEEDNKDDKDDGNDGGGDKDGDGKKDDDNEDKPPPPPPKIYTVITDRAFRGVRMYTSDGAAPPTTVKYNEDLKAAVLNDDGQFVWREDYDKEKETDFVGKYRRMN